MQSIPSHPISGRSILILFTYLRLVFPVVSFHLAFPPISYMHFSSPFVLYALPISSDTNNTMSKFNKMNRTIKQYFVNNMFKIIQFTLIKLQIHPCHCGDPKRRLCEEKRDNKILETQQIKFLWRDFQEGSTLRMTL
jgi:hypothetical protein